MGAEAGQLLFIILLLLIVPVLAVLQRELPLLL
jgi:hypothetical protein